MKIKHNGKKYQDKFWAILQFMYFEFFLWFLSSLAACCGNFSSSRFCSARKMYLVRYKYILGGRWAVSHEICLGAVEVRAQLPLLIHINQGNINKVEPSPRKRPLHPIPPTPPAEAGLPALICRHLRERDGKRGRGQETEIFRCRFKNFPKILPVVYFYIHDESTKKKTHKKKMHKKSRYSDLRQAEFMMFQ